MNPDRISEFARLFTLTDEAATQRITERIALVLRDPAAYQAQFANELEERGIMTLLPVQELRDIALIDALLSEDLAWESDWKESASEMAEGLNEILARQQCGYTLPTDTLVGGHKQGPEALDSLQDTLEGNDLALLLFTLDSDSYPLGVVADEQRHEVRKHAQVLGFTITIY